LGASIEALNDLNKAIDTYKDKYPLSKQKYIGIRHHIIITDAGNDSGSIHFELYDTPNYYSYKGIMKSPFFIATPVAIAIDGAGKNPIKRKKTIKRKKPTRRSKKRRR
jgi:hypothetical protein